MEAQDLVKIRSNHLWSCVITHDQPLCAWSQMIRPDYNFLGCINLVFYAQNQLITLDQTPFVREHKWSDLITPKPRKSEINFYVRSW